MMSKGKFCSTCKNIKKSMEIDPCKACVETDCLDLWEEKDLETFDQYQQATARTDNHTNDKEAILNFALGIAGEAGEIVDIVKKLIFHNHPADKEKMRDELGDQLWYVTRMASRYGLTLEEVAKANIDKLKKRYPDGFSQEKSINREESK